MKTLINDIEYEINEVDSNDSMLLCNGKRCNGTIHYLHQEIYIDKSLKHSYKYQTLCHELTHAFLFETQILDSESFDEEAVCELIGIYGKKIIDIANDYFK